MKGARRDINGSRGEGGHEDMEDMEDNMEFKSALAPSLTVYGLSLLTKPMPGSVGGGPSVTNGVWRPYDFERMA